jgi:hypothetical protein
MKLPMKKYLQRISRQGILNVMAANPKLVTFLIGLAIAAAFASFGRVFHEALAAPNPPGDPASHFPVDKIPKNALSGIFCNGCLDKNPIFGKILGDG